MTIRIEEGAAGDLRAYGDVPASFRVVEKLRTDLARVDARPPRLVAEPVSVPWVKDYDRDAGPPAALAARWDLGSWGVLVARDGDRRTGGALVAWRTPGVDMLHDRDDLAVLWDLRVRPERRREGVGARLFAAAEAWARARGCTRLDVETQDVNVAACHLYAARGCRLVAIRPGAYATLPDEVQLIWSQDLG